MAGGFVSAVTNFLSNAANGKTIPVSPTNPLPVAVISGGGGGGGGGAVTVADGADVAQGTTTNAAYADTTGAASGTIVSILKGLFLRLAGLPTVLTPVTLSAAQLGSGGSALAIPLPSSGGVQIQIEGLSADNLTITHSMSNNGYRPATLLKDDLSQTVFSATTGASNNGIFSVMVFGGYLKVLRAGSADTGLVVTIRGTN